MAVSFFYKHLIIGIKRSIFVGQQKKEYYVKKQFFKSHCP